MTSEYNEWYKITWKRHKPDLEAPLNQEWYSAANGPELVSAATEAYFLEQGIQHETSGPHNQHQNGVAELGIRTIMEMVRCMLRQFNAPRHLRGHAAKLAAHTRGFTPSNSLEGGETPNLIFYESRVEDGQPAFNWYQFGCYAVIHRGKQLVKDGKLSD
eukprot:2102201-Rhodomonas_salina.1